MNQAELNTRMKPWSEAEIARFLKRVAMFRRRGASEEAAEVIADHLALRDQERDDRRMCIECSNWQQSRTCFLKLPTSFDRLIRCLGFNWQTP